MEELTSLIGHFLVATPALKDPPFSKSVILICSYDAKGAVGLVLNRPLHCSVRELLEQIEIPASKSGLHKLPVFAGGPVESQRGFVLHERLDLNDSEWDATAHINDDLFLTSSRDILEAIGQGKGPAHFLLALGYAGWENGQLDQELRKNSWLVAPYASRILFDIPVEKRWEEAARLVGVDIVTLSESTGRA